MEEDPLDAAYAAARISVDRLRRGYPEPDAPLPAGLDGRWPDFLVIGAQRAGTTWTSVNLDYHPEIWMPPIKETNFFNEIWNPSGAGWERASRIEQAADFAAWFATVEDPPPRQRSRADALELCADLPLDEGAYRAIFAHAGIDSLCGEVAPDYAILPRAAIARIAAGNPALRAVLSLRDPIERVWSHLRRNLGAAAAGMNMAALRGAGLWPAYELRTNYPAILARWRAALGTERLLVLPFDDIAVDPAGFLCRICRHVGVVADPRLFPRAGLVVTTTPDIPAPTALYLELRDALLPIYESLAECAPEISEPWRRRHYG